MEHHTSPIGTTAPRANRDARRPLARFAAGLAALALLTATGCGGSAAIPSATLESLMADLEFTTVAAGTSMATTGPVKFLVKDSDGNPIGGADIDVYVGGSQASAVGIFTDSGLTVPAGDGFEWHTKTDEVGSVEVFPVATAAACGGATADLEGSFQVSATISGAAVVWTASFTIDCA